MKKLLLFILCAFTLVTFTSCFESSSGDDGDSGTFNSTGTITVSDSNMVSKNDTIWYDVSVKSGHSYNLDLRYGDGDYYMSCIIISSTGDTLRDYSFRADADGIYKVGIIAYSYNSDVNGPFEYSFRVTAFPPMPVGFSGKWLLVKTKGSAFGGSSERLYSTANAIRVIEFRNDSVIEYGYNSEADDTTSYAELFSDSWERHFRYSFSGNNLILSSSNKYGSASIHYERFEGDLNSLNWIKKDFKAPSELRGTWYLSYEKWREVEVGAGYFYDEEDEDIYSSGEESRKIYVITADSITTYRKSFFSVDSSKGPVSDYYWLLDQYTFSGNSFTNEEYSSFTWQDDEGEEYEAWSEIETYTKHLGFTPPLEWYQINMPATQIALPLNTQHSAVISLSDTLWYRIPVVSGTSYDVSFTEEEYCDIDVFVLDSDTTYINSPSGENGWHDFTAQHTGTYFLAVILDYAEGSNTTSTYSIKYEKYSGNGMATASEKRNKRERRGRRRER